MKNVGSYRPWQPAPWSVAPWREKVLYRLARLNWPALAGRLLRRSVRTLHMPPNPTAHVLLLTKRGFTEDALATLRLLSNVAVRAIDRPSIKAMSRAFLPIEVDDNNYRSASPEAQAQMVEYRQFLMEMWPSFDPEGQISLVMTGNFAYFAEQELADALETLDVPFVVLHKENMKSPGNQKFWGRIYRERRGPFRGRRILVYQPRERDLQVQAGIVEAERIGVVGMPRLDEVHEWRRDNTDRVPRKSVLFFSFLPRTGMPVITRKGASRLERYVEHFDESELDIKLTKLAIASHRAMFELAKRRPDIEVVIKNKSRFYNYVNFLQSSELPENTESPANLRVVGGSSPLPLLVEAAVVCGFNSTALLEALAMGRPVVVPSFAEALDPLAAPYIVDLGAAVRRAGSPDDLLDQLERLAEERRVVPARLDPEVLTVLNQWTGNSDGKASERAAAAIGRILLGEGSPTVPEPSHTETVMRMGRQEARKASGRK